MKENVKNADRETLCAIGFLTYTQSRNLCNGRKAKKHGIKTQRLIYTITALIIPTCSI